VWNDCWCSDHCVGMRPSDLNRISSEISGIILKVWREELIGGLRPWTLFENKVGKAGVCVMCARMATLVTVLSMDVHNGLLQP
jgi:hypothetical protein